MSENKFIPKEAQTFQIKKGDKIPPSEWEQDYWETWEEQGYTKSGGGAEKKDGRKECEGLITSHTLMVCG